MEPARTRVTDGTPETACFPVLAFCACNVQAQRLHTATIINIFFIILRDIITVMPDGYSRTGMPTITSEKSALVRWALMLTPTRRSLNRRKV